ncbi:MAG: DNA-binding response regulator [Planctomycetes bacterium]|jgi:DNA-binding response OmpR family regulator|nr:DNA-binding response regulator [Planctomycetota bacterium]
MRILLVDDDDRFRRFVTGGLSEDGHVIWAVPSIQEAWALVEAEGSGAFELILLDIKLPAQSGWEFLDELRDQGNETPVVFLTGQHSIEDRVRGLDAGADDYVIKPFALSELKARIRAVQRRRSGPKELVVGDLHIDVLRHRVARDGRPVDLSPREFDLLVALVEGQGSILSRGDLLSDVWGIEFDPGTNLVAVTVSRLRAKVDCVGAPMVQTVVGRGYRLAAAS